MKRSKIQETIIIAAILYMVFLTIFCIILINNSRRLYGMTTVVTHVSYDTDTVTVRDFNGNLWQFKDTEDWSVDDVATCIMDNKGTTLIKDDEILKVRYNGYFEGWNIIP